MPAHQKTPATAPFSLRSMALGLAMLLAPLGALAVDPKAAKFYEDALVRYEKKDLEGTIIQLKNALQIDKDMLPAQMLLGKALLRSGDVAAGEVALSEALRLGVNRSEIVIPMGQAYIAQGKHKQIFEKQMFTPVGLPPGTQVQLHLLRASASSDLGDLRGALQAVDEARAIDPKAAEVWAAEVPIRLRMRQVKEAMAAVDKAMSLAPNSAEVWYQKGAIQHLIGQAAPAIAAYEQALKLDPDHVEALIAHAGLMMDQKRDKELARDLDRLATAAPDEPRAAYLRALRLERAGKGEEARVALKDVTALLDPVPPDFIRYRPQLLLLNGLAHFGLNEREKAKQYLERFQKAQGTTPVSKLLAQTYISENSPDRAIEVLEPYLKAQPADGEAMILLGNALMAKGQNARAASVMQGALQTRDSPQFRTVLGLSLLRSGQSGSAIKELETALKGDPTQTQAAVSLVSLYLRSEETAKALEIAENLVKQQPQNALFFNLVGTARAQAGNAAGARTAFEQAVALNANFLPAKLNLARLEIATKAYDDAEARLAAILKVDDKNAEALFEMGSLSERRGRLAEAQRWLEKANDLSGPKEVRWSLALSDFHLRHRNLEAALDAARRASAKAPEDLNVTLALARAQLANADLTGAKSSLTAATRLADYNPTMQVIIAELQMAANNPGGATYSLEKALSTRPDYLPALALLAEVEMRQGDGARAEKRIKDILSRAPKRAVGYTLQGDLASTRGQTQAAVDSYRRAYEAEPSTDTVLRLFRALSRQDGGKPAVRLAEQWLKSHPRDNAVQKAVADHHARTGNFASARAGYEAAFKVNPEDADVLNNLANVLLQLKDPQGAAKMAETASSKQPGNPLIIDTHGWALYQLGQNDKALQLLRDARLRQPTNPDIRYHLAAVLARLGRKAEARDELEAALKGGNTFSSAAEADKLLRTLK